MASVNALPGTLRGLYLAKSSAIGELYVLAAERRSVWLE